MAPQALTHLADSILYLSSLLRDQPRQIDRYIDYFGGDLQARRSSRPVVYATAARLRHTA